MSKSHTPSIVLTGASKGLGRALALQYLADGARVVGVARGEAALAALAAEAAPLPGELLTIAADVGAPDAAQAIATRALDWLGGRVDLLVHDASTLGPVPMPELHDLHEGALARVFEVNVFGPWRLTRALLGSMRRAGRGLVVGLSSDAAVEAYAGWGAYGASKAALDHLLAIWNAELAGTGVRALTLDPGEMDTEMHAAALPDADPATLADPAAVARAIRRRLASLPAEGARFVVAPEPAPNAHHAEVG